MQACIVNVWSSIAGLTLVPLPSSWPGPGDVPSSHGCPERSEPWHGVRLDHSTFAGTCVWGRGLCFTHTVPASVDFQEQEVANCRVLQCVSLARLCFFPP